MDTPQIISYRVDDETVAQFEIEPPPGYQPAGIRDVPALVTEAAEPAVRAARVVLERMRALSPDGIEIKFGMKVTGTANWIIARSSADANFEVSLSWKPAGENAAE